MVLASISAIAFAETVIPLPYPVFPAQPVDCPAGYFCTPIPTAPTNCPTGYVCRPIGSTVDPGTPVVSTPVGPKTPDGGSSTGVGAPGNSGGTSTFVSPCSLANRYQVGSIGSEIGALQTFLIEKGFDIPAITSDFAAKGYFGNQTKTAVIKYQTNMSLPPTGIVDFLTLGKIRSDCVVSPSPVTKPLEVIH